MAHLITKDRLDHAIAIPPSIIPPSTIPFDAFDVKITSCRNEIQGIFHDIETSTNGPSVDDYKTFNEKMKRLLRYKQKYTTSLDVMNNVKNLLRDRKRGCRNIGLRQIDIIYILMKFQHHILTKQDILDILGLSESWAGHYWYNRLIDDNIIEGDKHDIKLTDVFMSRLEHQLPSPDNAVLLNQLKEYGAWRRNWNSNEIKSARNYVRNNKERYYPLQLQYAHQLDNNTLEFMQTFREHLNTIEVCLHIQPASPY